MTSALDQYMNRITTVVTGDGRVIIGLLKGFDQLINLVLEDAHERIYSEQAGVETVPLGLYIIRGENVVSSEASIRLNSPPSQLNFCSAVVGEIDEEIDKRIDFENLKASPLAPIWIPQ